MITERIDRALNRMRSEGYRPHAITIGEAEQRLLFDWMDDTAPTLLLRAQATPRDALHGMKYRGATILCVDDASALRVEGIWVDPVCEAEDLEERPQLGD